MKRLTCIKKKLKKDLKNLIAANDVHISKVCARIDGAPLFVNFYVLVNNVRELYAIDVNFESSGIELSIFKRKPKTKITEAGHSCKLTIQDWNATLNNPVFGQWSDKQFDNGHIRIARSYPANTNADLALIADAIVFVVNNFTGC